MVFATERGLRCVGTNGPRTSRRWTNEFNRYSVRLRWTVGSEHWEGGPPV